jgi:hypothetical protein
VELPGPGRVQGRASRCNELDEERLLCEAKVMPTAHLVPVLVGRCERLRVHRFRLCRGVDLLLRGEAASSARRRTSHREGELGLSHSQRWIYRRERHLKLIDDLILLFHHCRQLDVVLLQQLRVVPLRN